MNTNTRIQTVNVVEYFEGSLRQVLSFEPDYDGVRNAEETFSAIVRECQPDVTTEELDCYLADGTFEDDNGYQVFLVHSS